MTLRQQIMRELLLGKRMCVTDIARRVGRSPASLQATLHSMDDDGDVIMSNGYYWASVRAISLAKGRIDYNEH